MVCFDLDAYRLAHPNATAEDANAAHRLAVCAALYAQCDQILRDHAAEFQLADLQGLTLRVGINVAAPESGWLPSPVPDHEVEDVGGVSEPIDAPDNTPPFVLPPALALNTPDVPTVAVEVPRSPLTLLS